jgi:O-antigen/teichoic acid export membrane protein
LMAIGALAVLTLAYVIAMRLAFPLLIDQRYAQAASLFPVLAAVLWLRSIYQTAFSFLLYAGNTLPLAKANVIAAVINVGVNLALIPLIGLWAAPIALLAGFAALSIISLTYQARHFPVPWREALRP